MGQKPNMKLEIRIYGAEPLSETSSVGDVYHTVEHAGGPVEFALVADHSDRFVLLDQAERFLGGSLGYGPEDQFPSVARAVARADEAEKQAARLRVDLEASTRNGRGHRDDCAAAKRKMDAHWRRAQAALKTIKQLEGMAAGMKGRWPRGLRKQIENLRDDSFEWDGDE